MLQGHLDAPPQPSVSRLVRVSNFPFVSEVCLSKFPVAVSMKIALSGLIPQLHRWPAAAVEVPAAKRAVGARAVRHQVAGGGVARVEVEPAARVLRVSRHVPCK